MKKVAAFWSVNRFANNLQTPARKHLLPELHLIYLKKHERSYIVAAVI